MNFQLPASKRNIVVKLLTQVDIQAIEAEVAALRKNKIGSDADASLSTTLIYTIVSVDNKTDQASIRDCVNTMLAIDARALRSFISKMKPDIDLTCQFVDNKTNESFEMTLPLNINFFWPGV